MAKNKRPAQLTILKVGEMVKVFFSSFPGAKDYIGARGELTAIKANRKEVIHVVTFPDNSVWFYSRDQLRRAK